MPFSLRPYKELVAMAKDKVDEAMAPLRAHTAKRRADLKMAELDERIASINLRIQEMSISKEIDFDAIAAKIDEIELLELRKKRFEEIVQQLFPE